MKRVLLLAAVLAAILAQPAGAWIAIGQTADTGGVLFYQAQWGELTAELFDRNTGTSPLFSWYYPAQVEAALGGEFQILFKSYADPSPSGWWGGWEMLYNTPPAGPWLLLGDVTSVTYEEVSPGVVNFAAQLLSNSDVRLPDNSFRRLSEFGMTNEFRLTGTLVYQPGVSGGKPDGQFFQGPMVLSVKPIPEPVFFQMGALMGLSGLGLLRLRRKA
ncbi:MAG: hypothetical protein WHZ52_13300 [Armatimonadota bacterium]